MTSEHFRDTMHSADKRGRLCSTASLLDLDPAPGHVLIPVTHDR